MQQTLIIGGMSCGHCTAAVDAALRAVAGVERVAVDLATGQARVDGSASPDVLIAAVVEAGYEARLSSDIG